MKILAVDTSTDNAGLAVIENGKVLADITWNTGKTHTTELLPRLDTLLKSINLTINDIEGFACAIGPGSFNGLRVGISTVKGLALVKDLPCVGINTLDAIKACYDNKYDNMCIILPAGRKEVAYTLTQNNEPKIAEPAVLIEEILAPTYFVGEIKDEIKAELKSALNEKYLEDPISQISRVAMIGLLGEKELLQNSENKSAALLTALYLKRPNITKPKKYHYLQEQ